MMKLTAADGHELRTFEAGNVNAPRGLVVVQEIFGVNSYMRHVSERLAGYGYRVLCPALFDRVEPGVELGYTPPDAQRGIGLMSRLTNEGIMADIEATAAAFAGKPVGILGFCFGGTTAWWGATQTEAFKAAVCWYGGGIAATKDAVPHCPVQMHIGEHDDHIPLSAVAAIRAAQPGVEVFTYDAGHGFGCDERPSYSARDWELAELRSLAFLAQHVR